MTANKTLSTALHRAAAYEESQVATILNSNLGAAMLHQADKAGNTPLHHAAGFGTLTALQLLLEKTDAQTDINLKNHQDVYTLVFCHSTSRP